jgi:hypothetical protein
LVITFDFRVDGNADPESMKEGFNTFLMSIFVLSETFWLVRKAVSKKVAGNTPPHSIYENNIF